MTTLRSLIKGSLRLIRVVGANETPSDEDVSVSLASMRGLLDSLGTDLLNIYTIRNERYQFEAGKTEYTLGPAVDSKGDLTNADWVIERPMRVEKAVVLQQANIAIPSPPPLSVPDFIGSPLSGAIPLTVNFTDLSTEDPATWTWTMGDSTTLTTQNPTHTYTTAGDFTVSLTVTNDGGTSTVTKPAYVSALGPTPVRYYFAFPSGSGLTFTPTFRNLAVSGNLASTNALSFDASGTSQFVDGTASLTVSNPVGTATFPVLTAPSASPAYTVEWSQRPQLSTTPFNTRSTTFMSVDVVDSLDVERTFTLRMEVYGGSGTSTDLLVYRANNTFATGFTVANNDWAQYAMVFDTATGRMNFFSGGTLVYFITLTSLLTTAPTGNIRVNPRINGLNLASPATGTILIDEVRVSNETLYTGSYTPRTTPFPTNGNV